MLMITYKHIINETHFIEHQTRGKGRGTRPQIEAQPLLLNVIEIPLASIRGRPRFGGGLYTKEYGISMPP